MRSKEEREAKRIMTLDEGQQMALWFLPVELIREQDINARVMSNEKFDRLTENIKQTGVLESLPLCYLAKNQAGNDEFFLISGHHRTRAARKANVLNVYALVYERELTEDEVISKQISHNSLSGYDDKEILGLMYSKIMDVNMKIASGITELELKNDTEGVRIDDIKIELDYELINLLFLPRQVKELERIINLLDDEATVYIVEKQEFSTFADLARKIAKRDNIINMSAIFSRMLQIVCDHLEEKKKEEKKTDPDNKLV